MFFGTRVPEDRAVAILDRFVERGVAVPTRALGGVSHLVPVAGTRS